MLRNTGLGHFRGLRQETIVRMNGIRAGPQRRGDAGFGIQITIGGVGRANADGAVCKSGGQAICIDYGSCKGGLDSRP